MITDPDRRTRLLKLARLANFLDDLPHDRFHMPAWASHTATANSCGTAGCAGGWAATVYARDGWCFVAHNDDGRMTPCLKTMRPPPTCGRRWWWPFGRSKPSRMPDVADQFAAFFGISRHEAEWITLHIGGTAKTVKELRLPTYVDEYHLQKADDVSPRHAAARIRICVGRHDPTIVPEADGAVPDGARELVKA